MTEQDSTSPSLISRDDAVIGGHSYYFTGKPCVRGGVARRRVSDRKCVCSACAALEYQKSRKTILAKAALGIKYSSRYKPRQLSAEAKAKKEATRKARYEQNRHQQIEKVRAWQDLNHDRIRMRYVENAHARREYQAQYRAENAAKVHECRSRRRKAQMQRTPVWYGEFDEFVIIEAAALAVARRDATGVAWHVDHMVPMMGKTASGLHCGNNIQVIPASLNLEKGRSDRLTYPDEWLYSVQCS